MEEYQAGRRARYDIKDYVVRIAKHRSVGVRVALMGSGILTGAFGLMPQRAFDLAGEKVLVTEPLGGVVEPHGNQTRLTWVMRQYESLNTVWGRFGRGPHLKLREGFRPLMLAVVVVVMPVLSPEAGGASGQTRIFVTESTSWSVAGGDVVHDGDGAGSLQGGAKPQTAEIMKTISKRRECTGFVVTINREKADYILIIERVGGRDILAKDNKMALFDQNGDMVASSSTRSLGNAVKDACVAMQRRQ